MKNTGVILGQRNTDWVAGTIPYEVLNLSGDWRAYLPPGEWQYLDPIDTMACVSFSALNIIETLYYFHTGERRNFSDRFTAIMSGTTRRGNWLWKVGDSRRKDGLVDESDWSVPQDMSWDSYYETPTIEVINKAKEFLNDWIINYEVVDFTRDSLIYHLKQSPIQVVFPNHAVMNFFTDSDIYNYFDSYAPFTKERIKDFTYAFKYTMRRKNMKLIKKDKKVWAVINGKRFWVLDPDTLNKGFSIWGSWDDVNEDDPSKYEYAGAIFISGTDDPSN